jgi:hypothetical protein
MQQNWQKSKTQVYKRDILRDYCLSSAQLEEQFSRFHSSGTLSYSVMRGIIGDKFSKGLLWRLKDTARHLFENGECSSAGIALDWSIGFLFHECIIILEASYQLQKYCPAARAMIAQAGDQDDKSQDAREHAIILRFLFDQASDTQGSLSKMVYRADRLLSVINKLFCGYLAGESNNRALARLIYDREDLLRSVFKELYPSLLHCIYGKRQDKVFVEAAWSLLESGHHIKAERAVNQALNTNPDCLETVELLERIAVAKL